MCELVMHIKPRERYVLYDLACLGMANERQFMCDLACHDIARKGQVMCELVMYFMLKARYGPRKVCDN